MYHLVCWDCGTVLRSLSKADFDRLKQLGAGSLDNNIKGICPKCKAAKNKRNFAEEDKATEDGADK